MILGYARGNQLQRQIDELERYGAEEVFYDMLDVQNIFANTSSSEFQQLLAYAQAGDTLVLPALSVVSRDYHQLLKFIEGLDNQEIGLIVLSLPFESTKSICLMLRWVIQNDRFLHPRLFHIEKNNAENKQHYSLMTHESEARHLYKSVLNMLIRKEKLRTIAAANNVPIETVFRIKKELDKVKLCIFLIVVFFATVAGISIAQQFTDNFLLQISICLIATIAIVYNTLSDTDLE